MAGVQSGAGLWPRRARGPGPRPPGGHPWMMPAGSHLFARQAAGLLHPFRKLVFVQLALMDIEVAHGRMPGCAGGWWIKAVTPEEGHLHVTGEAVIAEEPQVILHAVERRVPLHRLLHARHDALDNGIQPAPDLALPAGHGRDLGLDRFIAIALGNLRIAAG